MAAGKSDMSLKVHEAALEYFSTRGYDGTSMRDIAKHLGVSVANLYNYTDGKESLFWAIMKTTVNELMQEQHDALTDETCSAGRFVVFAHTHATFHTRRAREVRLGNIPLESLSPLRAGQVRAMRDEYEGMLRTELGRGLEDGYFRTDQYFLAVRAILQMGIGISLWFRSEGPLTSGDVGNVYSAFAMAIAGYDAGAHDQHCSAALECRAATVWRRWAPNR